jgi:vacuolar-type H+-ATPase subunit H
MSLLKKRHLPIIVFMENEKLNALTEIPTHKRFDKYLKSTAKEFQKERREIFLSLSAMGIPNVESKAENFALSAVNRYIQLTG